MSFTFEEGHGEKHVYNFGTDPNFDETELNSIKFMEIIEAFGISREASRELIYLFRTILRNNLKGAEFKNGKLMETKKNQKEFNMNYIIRKNTFYHSVSRYFGKKTSRKSQSS